MGFLNLFSGKKKAVEINFSGIDEWLNQQVADKRLDSKIAKGKELIKECITQAHLSLEQLEKASLVNTNIPERAKQIMEGHRKTYVQRISRFLTDISVPDDFSQIGNYSAVLSESISRLSEETQKNYLVLREFMESDLSKVVRSIKNIEESLAKLQSDIDKEGIELIKEAKIRLKHYSDDLNKKAKLEQEKEREEGELDMLLKKKEKMEARMQDLKGSSEYGELKSTIDEKKQHEQSINDFEQEIIGFFAELNRPLKKFTHNTPEENLVDSYIADPVGSLEEDHELRITRIIAKMGSEIDTLELKDNQLEKTSELIKKVNCEYLRGKKEEIERIKDQNKDAATKINRSVVALNIAETESWLKSIEQKIEQSKKHIDYLAKQLEEINIDYLRQKVKEKVKEIDPTVKIIDGK